MVAGGTARLTAPPAPPVQRSSRSNPVLNRLRKDSNRVVLNAINIDGAMTFVSTPNVDLARDGLAGAGRAA